ncbi:MAG: aminotransferase class III-fold pyridoxal phosphate-dependent enzyme [Gemmatimonadota bacterium]
MTDHRVQGFTSTGSKRPDILFGPLSAESDLPRRMRRSSGCRVWDDHDREYLDFIMALGAVALGYGHPEVNPAAIAAIENGVVGSLAPTLEEEVAEELGRLIPWMERVRFLKTGAEGVAAAVRISRAATGRERVLGCGYHGWLDWCHAGSGEGVPAVTRALYRELPFNDPEITRAMIREGGDQLACVVVEPIVVTEPSREWLEVLREETTRAGVILVFDEIKTAFRVAIGGGAERYAVAPDLVVIAKAFANGFPLAAVGGKAEVMEAASRTWISSTLSTELVSLAAAKATMGVMVREQVPAHLHRIGTVLLHGLHALQRRYPDLITGVGGIAEMAFFQYATEETSRAVAAGCALRGILFKRSAYNFVSLAHGEPEISTLLKTLEDVLQSLRPAGSSRG